MANSHLAGTQYVEGQLGDPDLGARIDRYQADLDFREAQPGQNISTEVILAGATVTVSQIDLERRMLATFISQAGYLHFGSFCEGIIGLDDAAHQFITAKGKFLGSLGLTPQTFSSE